VVRTGKRNEKSLKKGISPTKKRTKAKTTQKGRRSKRISGKQNTGPTCVLFGEVRSLKRQAREAIFKEEIDFAGIANPCGKRRKMRGGLEFDH